MAADLEATRITSVGVFATVAGVAAGAMPATGVAGHDAFVAAGVLYAVVGSAALVMVRRGRASFVLALLATAVASVVAASDLLVLQGLWSGSPLDLWGSLNAGLRPISDGGLSWGFAAGGASLTFALGVASRGRQQWVAAVLLAFALLPILKALLPALTGWHFGQMQTLAWAVLATSLTAVVAAPLYRLGLAVRGASDVDAQSGPRRGVAAVAGGLVWGVHALAVGVLLTTRPGVPDPATAAVLGVALLWPVLYVGFPGCFDLTPAGRMTE